MTQAIFSEYDIRGIFGNELDENSVKNIGLALGKRIQKFGLMPTIIHLRADELQAVGE